MSNTKSLRWGRIILSVVIAEVLPILALVAVVVVYGLVRAADSPTPEEWAPLAGKWVGPIGGFLATLTLSLWCARRAGHRPLAHGLAVGIGTALLDVIMCLSLGGIGSIEPVFVASNMGRVIAGFLEGWLVSRSNSSKAT